MIDNEYTISLKHFNHLYLTAYGDTNGSKTGYGAVDGNIRWAPLSSNSNSQKWKFNPTTPSSSNNPDLQEFDIINKGDKKFAFRLKSNPNLYISAKENINNGEITLQLENSSYQQTWSFFDYTRKINGSSSGGSSGNKNYATYPCKTMNLSQGYRDGNHADYDDFPFDEKCEDENRSWIYCPCDKMKVTRVYGVSNAGTNTIWLESVGDVDMPCGKGIFTMMVMHPEDDDLSNISEGQTFLRGEKMFREGKDGKTSGNHFHISLGKGSKIGNGWVEGRNGAFNITTTGGAIKAEDVFYLDESFTSIKNSKGIFLAKLPK